MSWVKAAAGEIRYDFDGRMQIFISKKDLELHPEVERIRRMEISNEEKVRLLTEKEKDILDDVLSEKYSAVAKYAESQGSKIDRGEYGTPEGTVDWNEVLGLWEPSEPAV